MPKLIFANLFFIVWGAFGMLGQESTPRVVSGSIERIEHFASAFVTARHIDIWLPENYSDSAKYATLYMHDGQMLFDANQTWNKQAWNVDDVASKLIDQGSMVDFIVVGIWNGGKTRHQDYFPNNPLNGLSKEAKVTIAKQLRASSIITQDSFTPVSDDYLRFIVEELKPFVDRTYSVYTEPEYTYVAGSSMGGLISIYAVCEYPEVFGGAACMSTHWPGTFTLENNPMPQTFIAYLSQNLPDPNTHRIYFDCGDETLDALYPAIQKQVDEVMRNKGYDASNWMTMYFPGENHSENAWYKRLRIPLLFLFQR